jgi:HEAT repeat protein
MIRPMIRCFTMTLMVLALCGCDASPRTQKNSRPVPAVVTETLHTRATTVLREGTRSDQAIVRANAIEMMESETELLRDAILRGVVDPNEGVRFVSVMALGKRRLCGSIRMVRPLLDDPSPSVRAAAIFSLVVCGDEDVDQTPLAGMVLSQNRATRANAALVLSEIGNPTAKPLLREAMKQPLLGDNAEAIRTSELGLAAALVRLGDRRQLEMIRAAFFAPASQGELTALASQMAGRLNDRTLVPAMGALAMASGPRQAGPELRLIAAEALGRIDSEMAMPGLAAEYYNHWIPEVRMQAALVLSWDRSPLGIRTLEKMLDDPNERVRISAAGAILRRKNGRVPKSPIHSKPDSIPAID